MNQIIFRGGLACAFLGVSLYEYHQADYFNCAGWGMLGLSVVFATIISAIQHFTDDDPET